MPSDNMIPTERIEQMLAKRKLTKRKLAQKVGVAPTTLSTWINRGCDFPASYVVAIAMALDVHPMWLLTGNEDITPFIDPRFVELTDDERYLIDTYRALDRDGRTVVTNKAVEEKRRAKFEQGSEVGETRTAG